MKNTPEQLALIAKHFSGLMFPDECSNGTIRVASNGMFFFLETNSFDSVDEDEDIPVLRPQVFNALLAAAKWMEDRIGQAVHTGLEHALTKPTSQPIWEPIRPDCINAINPTGGNLLVGTHQIVYNSQRKRWQYGEGIHEEIEARAEMIISTAIDLAEVHDVDTIYQSRTPRLVTCLMEWNDADITLEPINRAESEKLLGVFADGAHLQITATEISE